MALVAKPDETRLVPTPRESKVERAWVAERWGTRYLFIGPTPVPFLYHSVEATDWEAAIGVVVKRWNDCPRPRRDFWYGVEGRYMRGGEK